ncbi:MAG: CPA2 family monovalent cation:H+ antiporter-2 [Sphingobacteriales bacterium]|jgi:CPA2 family monovalent cation:H+ antiporter-2
MDFQIIKDLVIIMGLSIPVILLCKKIKLPSLIGFLITGVVCGPGGFSLISGIHEVELMAETGVILLLFMIGTEISLSKLFSMKRALLTGGGTQLILTLFLSSAVIMGMGYSFNLGLFFGIILTLSSTAIILNQLAERGETDAPQGRMSLGILIFQDLMVVPLMLIIPLLAGKSGGGLNFLIVIGKAILVVGTVVIAGRFIIPKLLAIIARSKSRELLLFFLITLCLSTAWLTSEVGLSLSLGAFLAGLMISESDYTHDASGMLLPFKEVFTGIFFVSIGMLLEVSFFASNILTISLITIGIFAIKFFSATMASIFSGQSLRNSIMVGFILFQVGEFSFILASVGLENELLDEHTYRLFLATSILTMALTPFAINKSSEWARKIITITLPNSIRIRLGNIQKLEEKHETESAPTIEEHIAIIGYGFTGKQMSNIAKTNQIPIRILELNAETVNREQANGEPIFYGDAMREDNLKILQIHKAKVVVIAISDPNIIPEMVKLIRKKNPHAYIITKSRYATDRELHLKNGANESIPEEFEASLNIFTRVLGRYLVAQNEIHRIEDHLRKSFYSEASTSAKAMLVHQKLPNLEITSVKLAWWPDKFKNKALAHLKLRENFGIQLVALTRRDKTLYLITPDLTLKCDDIIYIMGRKSSVRNFVKKVEDCTFE